MSIHQERARASNEQAPLGCMTALLAMLAAFGALAIDPYLPALPTIGADLGASPAAVQLSVTLFLAGFTVGMLFCGPLSDRFGRRPVLLGGVTLFALASLGCMLAGTVEQLIAARLFQMRIGCVAALSGALVLPGAVLCDAPVWLAMGGTLAVVSMTGLLGANGIGLLMARFPQDAGAAAGLFGAAQFGFGALASVAVSLLHDGRGASMACVILVAASLSMLGQRLHGMRAAQKASACAAT